MGQLGGIVRGAKSGLKIVRASDADAVLVQRASVLGAANEGPDFCDAREMRGVKTADGTATDDANALHLGLISQVEPSGASDC